LLAIIHSSTEVRELLESVLRRMAQMFDLLDAVAQ
jgi:hypothetical protein